MRPRKRCGVTSPRPSFASNGSWAEPTRGPTANSSGGTDARPDGEFELLVDHDKLSTEAVPYPEAFECFKGRVFNEKVLRFDPPRLLQTTFQGDKGGIVTYELIPEGPKTRLVLTHSDIKSPSGFQDFGGGWTSHLAVLQEKLAGRAVPDFWALHAQSREAVRKALEG